MYNYTKRNELEGMTSALKMCIHIRSYILCRNADYYAGSILLNDLSSFDQWKLHNLVEHLVFISVANNLLSLRVFLIDGYTYTLYCYSNSVLVSLMTTLYMKRDFVTSKLQRPPVKITCI